MNICVYGASSNLIDDVYIKACEELGRELARRGHTLIFGGGANGVMGAVARGVNELGGKIIGIAPSFFSVDGVLFEECDEMIRPETMRERKRILEDMADAFITAPGGIGTYDEFFEILTLKQLGRHKKAIAIFDVDGYYDRLINLLEDAIEKKFLREACKKLYEGFVDINTMLDYIEGYEQKDFNILEMKNI